jgi:hypothetical protein
MMTWRLLRALWEATEPKPGQDQALWGGGRDRVRKTDESAKPAFVSKFLFISRHPLAVAMAQKSWGDTEHYTLPQLVQHWLFQHETLAGDLEALAGSGETAPDLFTKRIWLEDLDSAKTQGGVGVMKDVLDFLDLSVPLDRLENVVRRDVKPDQNDKYFRKFCGSRLLLEDRKLLVSLEPRVQKVSGGRYSVTKWVEQCPRGYR